MIKIHNVNWLDEASYEGEITLVDSHNKKLVCFTYSEPLDIIAKKLNIIYGMGGSEVIRSDEHSYSLGYLGNFEYYVVGQVLDRDIPLIQCFDYILKFSGVLPGDIVSGDWVECSIDRFDIYK
ncbi:hypothetical protein [Streptococcus ruminantium]|uniref:hypothetical protein n=1 Tax=Streptococcus ruminantium TaxID=1917441 RepID=UPI0012DEF20F|nr:hypothetical protein [Streptococcus ruminantium]